jgi:hypothetical protein
MENSPKEHALEKIKTHVNFPGMQSLEETERWVVQHLAGSVITVYKGYYDLFKMYTDASEIEELTQTLNENGVDTILFKQYETYGLDKSDISEALSTSDGDGMSYFEFIIHHAQQLDCLIKELIKDSEQAQVRQVKISHLIKEIQDFLAEYEQEFKQKKQN